jgi:hypothetical protein
MQCYSSNYLLLNDVNQANHRISIWTSQSPLMSEYFLLGGVEFQQMS